MTITRGEERGGEREGRRGEGKGGLLLKGSTMKGHMRLRGSIEVCRGEGLQRVNSGQ